MTMFFFLVVNDEASVRKLYVYKWCTPLWNSQPLLRLRESVHVLSQSKRLHEKHATCWIQIRLFEQPLTKKTESLDCLTWKGRLSARHGWIGYVMLCEQVLWMAARLIVMHLHVVWSRIKHTTTLGLHRRCVVQAEKVMCRRCHGYGDVWGESQIWYSNPQSTVVYASNTTYIY